MTPPGYTTSLHNPNAITSIDPGLPSTPQNVVVSIVKNGTANVTVNIDWGSPVNAGGGVLDSYTVETSPESSTVRVISGTRATLNLTYNVRYVVKVAAENCVGRSSFSMETVKIGMHNNYIISLLAIVLLHTQISRFNLQESLLNNIIILHLCTNNFLINTLTCSWLRAVVQPKSDIRTLH